MRYRVKTTGRTWLLVLVALVASGIITYLEHERRVRDDPPSAASPPVPGEVYEVDVEIAE